jgi:hypothetical protein
MVLRRPRKKVLLAGFAAEAQAVMVVGDKAEFSTAACAAILRSRHETVLRLEVGHAMLSSARVSMTTNSSHRPISTASALCACRRRSAAPAVT